MTVTRPQVDCSDLPGWEEIQVGIEHLKIGKVSTQACLAQCCSPRLIEHGLLNPELAASITEPELELYRLLVEKYGIEAYSRYSSLIRRVASFGRALDHRAKIHISDLASE